MSTPTQPTEEQKYAALQRFIADWKPGMKWQWRNWGASTWNEEAGSAASNWDAYEYRIPPAPKIEPWDFETAPGLTMRVRRKSDGATFRAEMRPASVELFGAKYDDDSTTYADFATDFIQLSGRPCGQEATV